MSLRREVANVWAVCFGVILTTAGFGHAQTVEPRTTEQTRDTLSIDLKLAELDKDTVSYSEFGLYFLCVTSTDELDEGYGGGIVYDYTRFEPLIIRTGLQLARTNINAGSLNDADMLAVGFDLGLLARLPHPRFKPYAGLGMTVYSNTWPSDHGPEDWIGPYDDKIGASVYDYGDGLAFHLRAGSKMSISRRFMIDLDLRYVYARPTADLTWRNSVTLEEWQEKIKYDQRVLTAMLGLSFLVD